MKKVLFLFYFLSASTLACAQLPNLTELKACKDVVQAEYIQFKESDICYPVFGLTDVHMQQMTAMGKGAGGGGLYAIIEVWIVDAKGRIVYNYIHTINPGYATNNEAFMDEDYMKYMNKNSNKALKNRISY